MEILDQPAPAEAQYNFDQKVSKLLADGYNFSLGDYISAGHRILMSKLGSYIGFLFLFFVISIIFGIIPFFGSAINFIIESPLIMGFAIVSRKIFYNKSQQFNNFFDGFKFLGPLVAIRLIILVVAIIVFVPYILIVMGPQIFQMIESAATGDNSMLDESLIMSRIIWVIPLAIIALLGQALLIWAPYIAVFGRKGPLESITTSIKLIWKRYLQFVLFLIVLFFINVGGAILLVVGLLYTVPLTFCSIYAAYEMIVGTNPNDELLDR